MEAKKKRLTLDLEPTFQRRLKVVAAIKGVTMRQYCHTAIDRELANDERQAFSVMYPVGRTPIASRNFRRSTSVIEYSPAMARSSFEKHGRPGTPSWMGRRE